ncbi:alpha/beta-hydrolase [Piromyces finnis]|uniref:Alpha/beta-hydrolase n=1 Tax=Piromyces finnis TaxID=1754191 RepID=A0A1Y1UY32_9FUNG|nr:alpha/beta-hydrolase [Piromyces finnis]|eukprot:ORX43248.1 alpha/beta-hydrolase [Piromyces finnis]
MDIYYNKDDSYNKKPVVVYIYGGIWFLGEKTLYSKLGEFLNELGYVGVIPNYVQFPFGHLDDMVYDIGNSLAWIYNNIDKYGGDNQNIIVIGHSSGAHLTALGLFKSTLGLKGIGVNSITQHYPPIKKAILLGGPFDFDAYSYHTRVMGESVENSKFEAFASFILGSEQSCPTDILKEYSDHSINYLGAEHFTIVHFSEDQTVPKSIALGLYEQMQRVGNTSVDLYIAEGFSHTGVTEGVMTGEENAKEALFNIINH